MNYVNKMAKAMRIDIIEEVAAAGSGHPGGSLSATDILAALYFDIMNIDPRNPRWEDRDRLILSKGHVAPALYAALAERGYFSKETLKTLRKSDSFLQGHPDMKGTPGVDMSSGSLGQGLSAANGMELAGRLNHKDYYVYVILGDGEIQEGQIWEAAMSSAHYKLDHVIAFLDFNGLQIDGRNEEVMNVKPVDEKFRSFGWDVQVIDGHDCRAISVAVDQAKQRKGKPSMIICETVKGKGVSFMENHAGWHGSAPNAEQTEQALRELRAIL